MLPSRRSGLLVCFFISASADCVTLGRRLGDDVTAVGTEDGPTVGDVEAGIDAVSRLPADVAVQPLGSHGAGLTCYLT